MLTLRSYELLSKGHRGMSSRTVFFSPSKTPKYSRMILRRNDVTRTGRMVKDKIDMKNVGGRMLHNGEEMEGVTQRG